MSSFELTRRSHVRRHCPELALLWLTWLSPLGAWWGFLAHGINPSLQHSLTRRGSAATKTIPRDAGPDRPTPVGLPAGLRQILKGVAIGGYIPVCEIIIQSLNLHPRFMKLFTLLDLCVSSLCGGHTNILCYRSKFNGCSPKGIHHLHPRFICPQLPPSRGLVSIIIL